MTMADTIRSHVVERYLEPARRRGEPTVTVVAGDVHRDLQLVDRAPSVCSALRARKFLKEHNLELVTVDGPRAKTSTTTTFTYSLRLAAGVVRPARNALRDLRGAGKELFTGLGGGERWLRGERERFHEAGAAETLGMPRRQGRSD